MKKIKMEKSQLAREVAKQKTKLLEKRKETKEVTKKPMLKIMIERRKKKVGHLQVPNEGELKNGRKRWWRNHLRGRAKARWSSSVTSNWKWGSSPK